MYSKEELKYLKTDFWEGFGAYCAELPAFTGRKSKFLLYNTKMKGVELKFDATRNAALVILEINHSNADKRFELYEKFETYKVLVEQEFENGLIWDFAFVRECGTEVCRIYSQKTGIDIHRRKHWPEFYEFMAPEMLKLENAFRLVKEAIED